MSKVVSHGGLAVFKNLDKNGWMEEEQWSVKYNQKNPTSMLNFPTCKMLLIARPNSGKTNFIKNTIVNQHPDFEKIIIVHHDPDTTEYDDIIDGENIILTTEIPTVDMFDAEYKNLCVIDDVYTKRLSKEDEKRLNKLFTYISSHRHCHVIISVQDYTTVPPPVRRAIDVFVMWKMIDLESQKILSKKFGLSNTALYTVFRNPDLIKTKYDCLVVDLLPDAPSKFRINGLVPVDAGLDGNDALDDEIYKREKRKQHVSSPKSPTTQTDNVLKFKR